jgi:hypothetical protein
VSRLHVEAEQTAHAAPAVVWALVSDALTYPRADITLAPVPGGTRIHWAASWDNTLLGRVVHRSLRQSYPQIVAGLAQAAGRQATAAPGRPPRQTRPAHGTASG